MDINYATIGEITLDDTVLETGEVMRGQIGGGAVYSALGIRLWGHTVGINAVVGQDFPDEVLKTLKSQGVSTDGIRRFEGWSLRLWLLHEENNKKQQLPKLQSANLYELDQARCAPPESYHAARGFHLAPATTEGQMRSCEYVRQKCPDALISLDTLVAPFINLDPYQDGAIFNGIHIFSPSIAEVEILFPGKSVDEVIQWVSGFGVRWIAIKMDTRGSIVCDAVKSERYHIPIYPVNTVDSTGAGDAFSAGFLEGIVETGSVLEAGMRGTVSASFAVQHWGAFDMLAASRQEAETRLSWLEDRVNHAGDAS